MCVDNTANIKITAMGQHVAHYTLTSDKIYYNQKATDSTLTRATKIKEASRHNRNNVSRLHIVPPAGLEPATKGL